MAENIQADYVNHWDYMFPVIAGETIYEDGKYKIPNPQVFGTASYIGNGFFITAGHVIENAQSVGKIRLGYFNEIRDNAQLQTISSLKNEVNHAMDVGILFVHDLVDFKPRTLMWKPEFLSLNTEVLAVGFPFAVDLENKRINARSFAGRIAARGKFLFKPNSQVVAYELSFPVPRGLSGAPLLDHHLSAYGVIVGNNEMEMEVTYSKEELKDGGVERTYIRREYLSLGVANAFSSFKDIHFEILEGTLESYLKTNSLLLADKTTNDPDGRIQAI